jgi:hypothetical protein
VNEIVASASPTAADTPVGALGTVDGVTADDAVEPREVPMPFVAVTTNVYAVPFVNPLIRQVSTEAVVVQDPETTLPAVYAVTEYPVKADPLILTGGSQEILAEAFPATAVTLIGTDGAALTAILVDAVEAADVPARLVAVTLKV